MAVKLREKQPPVNKKKLRKWLLGQENAARRSTSLGFLRPPEVEEKMLNNYGTLGIGVELIVLRKLARV